jgi:hypothetical protein
MYTQYMQSLCQCRLSTADHALLLVATATTAVYSLERLPLATNRLSLYSLGSDSMENNVFYCKGVLSLSCLGNSLGSDHIENTSSAVLMAACVLRACLPSNGVSWLHSLML